MSIRVRTFDDKRIKRLIAEADPELREYIAAQQHALDGYKSTLAEAMKKIFELSRAQSCDVDTDDRGIGARMLGPKGQGD